MKITVFASGTGTNFEALVKSEIGPKIALVICDKAGAKVLDKASKLGVPAFLFRPQDYPSKADFETAILAELRANDVEWIVLAGYMRLIGETLLLSYPNHIINLHPSLLPKYPGKDAILQALSDGAHETGVTAHFVDAGMDTGQLLRAKVFQLNRMRRRRHSRQKFTKSNISFTPKW
ncbi:Phosphoribosylglycinamide formyltransferase [Listeria fleischmannii subsp. fleischmannii]|uniref:Phosphoribosylglycinamide formyltransferase n=1 Tax=Listeria fleischmannii subsp. fleischmannii TaxID=1671902 RepID=A0A2X3H9Q4_9LIST|nr:phosphoribosylglycinamide formyltransferase [Listeria fleischmannii]SQC71276.1 Phosphoribosylglycinamide formyltransferase [Listeria fleischmannii subsp. fleischmannii]